MKRSILTLLLAAACWLPTTALQAQNWTPEEFESRFTRLNKAYSKSPNDVEALYDLATFYFEDGNPMRNLPMAMKYIQRTEACHIKLIEDDKTGELGRLVRLGITLPSIRQAKQSIIDSAYKTIEMRTDMSGVELDTYMDAFGIDIELVRLLRQRRINQVYDETLKKGTVEAYHHFVSVYPGTDEAGQMEARIAKLAPGLFEGLTTESAIDEVAKRYPMSPSVQRAAEKQKSRQAYAIASKRNTVEAYNDFLHRYPASDESEQARERLDNLLVVTYSKCKSAMDYANFATTYPDISLSDKALGEMRRLIYEQQDVEAARYYLEHFKLDPHYIEVYNRFYSWHAAEGNGDPLRRFQEQYPDYPFQRTLEEDLDRAEKIDRVNLMADFLEVEYPRYSEYVRQLTGKGIALIPLQRMIQLQVASRNYQAALDRVRRYDICFENTSNKEYRELQRLLSTPPTGRRVACEFAATYHIMHPTLNQLDGRLYFTRVSGSNHRVCYAVMDGGEWHSAGEVSLSGLNSTEGYTFYGFYADGSRMLLGHEGNIMMAQKEGDSWRITDIPPYPVNTDYLETDAYMLPDGSGLLLASDRPGGRNLQASGAYFHGDTAIATDLYFIPYINNAWGDAVNLGNTINTPYMERSPILSRNLKTLYFISDGRGGLGYGDIYMCTRKSVHDWTSWSEPQNIGKDINTGFSEATVSFSPDEKRLLFSSNQDMGRYACYAVATTHDAANSYEPYTIDILGMESSLLRVRVADLVQQSVTQVVDCSGESNSVTFNVHKDKQYAVIGDAGTYFVPAIIVDPKVKAPQRLKGYTFPVLVAMDKPVPLLAVDYEPSAARLTPVAELQLQQLAHFLTLNPRGVAEFAIDVAGGDETLCYNLSLERGRLIRDYLNYRGIDNSRIIISAYGNVNVKRHGKSAVSVRFRE